MSTHAADIIFRLIIGAPLYAVPLLLVYFCLLRLRWRFRRRLGKKNLGFRPSTADLGCAFQLWQAKYRPTVAHVIEAKQQEDTDEDDDGGPDHPARHLHKQLKRIRHGEQVDRLTLRR